MKTVYLVIAALVAAVIVLAVRLATVSNHEKEKDMTDTQSGPAFKGGSREAAYENIMTRYSVRRYQRKAVPADIEEKILRAGMAAPSAVNKQPWHFVVVRQQALKDSIAAEFKNAHMTAQAPLVIVVCGDLDKALEGEAQSYWVQDCSAATENILLAANALGLGGVWCGVYPIAERVETMRALLGLSRDLVPLNIINIGYPEGEPQIKDKWSTNNISYK